MKDACIKHITNYYWDEATINPENYLRQTFADEHCYLIIDVAWNLIFSNSFVTSINMINDFGNATLALLCCLGTI